MSPSETQPHPWPQAEWSPRPLRASEGAGVWGAGEAPDGSRASALMVTPSFLQRAVGDQQLLFTLLREAFERRVHDNVRSLLESGHGL